VPRWFELGPAFFGVGPYREGTTPEVTLACSDCQESFRTKVGSGATRCGVCRVKVMEAQRAENDRAIARATYELQQSRSNAGVIRYVVIAAIGFGLALMKFQMRKSLQEDMSVGESEMSWRRTAELPRDEAARDQVSKETDRFRDCYMKLLDEAK